MDSKAPVAALAVAGLLAALAGGCGEDEGVAKGATVTAYVVPPLCRDAQRALARAGGRAGDLRLKAICLPGVVRQGRLRLATVGSDARRASEDSTAVAFLEAPGGATRFSHPILETAEIPRIVSRSGGAAMAQLLRAIERAEGSGSLRSTLSDALE